MICSHCCDLFNWRHPVVIALHCECFGLGLTHVPAAAALPGQAGLQIELQSCGQLALDQNQGYFAGTHLV